MRPLKIPARRSEWFGNSDRLKLFRFVLTVLGGGVAITIIYSRGRDNSLHEQPDTVQVNPPDTVQVKHWWHIPSEAIDDREEELLSQSDGCMYQSPSLHSVFSGAFTYELKESPLDFERVTISAWIYLTKSAEEKNMKTILSNRASGCIRDQEHNGFAFYVNDWNTDDRSLNLMWQDRSDPCARLGTVQNVIQYDTWHHVGATLELSAQGHLSVRLFVDGLMKASKTFRNGRKIAHSGSKFVVGGHGYGGDIHPFTGKIAHVAVIEGVDESFASSYPAFFKPQFKNTVRAYFKVLMGDSPVDSFWHPFRLVKNKFEWTPEDKPPGIFEYLVPLGLAEELASGTWPQDSFYLTGDLKEKSDNLARERREVVKSAMKHAYYSYEDIAFGADEVTPRSAQPRNNRGGMAVTMVDALDTL